MSQKRSREVGTSRAAKSRFSKRKTEVVTPVSSTTSTFEKKPFVCSSSSTCAVSSVSIECPTMPTTFLTDQALMSTISSSTITSSITPNRSRTTPISDLSDCSSRSSPIEKLYLEQEALCHNESNLAKKISSWSLSHGIKHNALSNLLKILTEHGHKHELPADARTILKTPLIASVNDMDIGEFCHFSLNKSLEKLLSLPRFCDVYSVTLDINIDSVPLFKSTSFGLWLILGAIKGRDVNGSHITSKPFIISVYGGVTKPRSPNKFTHKFVEEMLIIERNGIQIGNKCVLVEMGLGIFDSPARSFILYTKGHSGYSSCSQCIVKGLHHKKRRIFVDTNAELRTNKSFKNRTHANYHRGSSNLEKLKMGMVTQVPLDYLHIVLLGVTKRFCFIWVESYEKIIVDDVNKLSNRLIAMKEFVPREFTRKPRSIIHYRRWKGTEFRQFLLYYSMFVLHDVLDVEKYNHFMCFVVALRILVVDASTKQINYAESLLLYFVKNAGLIYGQEVYTHNFHNLIHLAENVRRHGSLDNFSAFPFENFMTVIKRMVRKPNAILSQIYNRCAEQSFNFHSDIDTKSKAESTRSPKFLHKTIATYQACQFGDMFLNNSSSDCGVQLKDGTYGKIYNFRYLDAEMVFDYNKIVSLENLFNSPCVSSLIGIFKGIIDETVHTANIFDIRHKICLLPLNKEQSIYSVVPILHFSVINSFFVINLYYKII